MKLFLILSLAMFAYAEEAVRSDYVESWTLIQKNYLTIMKTALAARNGTQPMHFTMMLNALLDLGLDYWVSPSQYNTTYLPVSVQAMSEELINPGGFLDKGKTKFVNTYKHIGLIVDVIENDCDVSDMDSECDEKILAHIKKADKEEKQKLELAVKILFESAYLSNILLNGPDSIWKLSERTYPLVIFLNNSQGNLPLVQLIAHIRELSEGKIRPAKSVR